MAWHDEGKDPDYRFSLANERTFLAWMRTALGVLAGGVLLHQFATTLAPRHLISGLAIALTLVAGVMGAVGYLRWRNVEIAMRMERPLPLPVLVPLLSVVVSLLALITAAMLLWG